MISGIVTHIVSDLLGKPSEGDWGGGSGAELLNSGNLKRQRLDVGCKVCPSLCEQTRVVVFLSVVF